MERYLNLFSLSFLGVVFSLFLTVFSTTPILCGLGPFVQLPWSNTATVIRQSDDDLEIRVTADGRIIVGISIVPAQHLQSALHDVARRTSTQRHVLVSADRKVPYAVVQDVLAASQRAGFRRVSLVTFRGIQIDALQKAAGAG